MNTIEFTILIAAGSFLTGIIGALTGIGGGIIIVPMLAILFKVDIHYAIGASLISVIATSSGAASAYIKEGFTNLRIGLFLEIATTIGALVGAFLATMLSDSIISVVFGVVLLYSAVQSFRCPDDVPARGCTLATRLKLEGTYPSSGGPVPYHVDHVPGGFALMFGAGALSGLLGIGSGAIKVLAMDQVMRIPFKVSTTTSNFMIGVTAAASAGVYFSKGYIVPGLAMPVMLGVLAGSLIGARVLVHVRVRPLRLAFSAIVLVLALEMTLSGMNGFG